MSDGLHRTKLGRYENSTGMNQSAAAGVKILELTPSAADAMQRVPF
jgi:hypothetical protein